MERVERTDLFNAPQQQGWAVAPDFLEATLRQSLYDEALPRYRNNTLHQASIAGWLRRD